MEMNNQNKIRSGLMIDKKYKLIDKIDPKG